MRDKDQPAINKILPILRIFNPKYRAATFSHQMKRLLWVQLLILPQQNPLHHFQLQINLKIPKKKKNFFRDMIHSTKKDNQKKEEEVLLSKVLKDYHLITKQKNSNLNVRRLLDSLNLSMRGEFNPETARILRLNAESIKMVN